MWPNAKLNMNKIVMNRAESKKVIWVCVSLVEKVPGWVNFISPLPMIKRRWKTNLQDKTWLLVDGPIMQCEWETIVC